MSNNPFVSKEEFARISGATVKSVYNWIRIGRLAYFPGKGLSRTVAEDMAFNEEDYYTLTDLQDILFVSRPTLHRGIYDNLFPYIKTFKGYRVRKQDLELVRTGLIRRRGQTFHGPESHLYSIDGTYLPKYRFYYELQQALKKYYAFDYAEWIDACYHMVQTPYGETSMSSVLQNMYPEKYRSESRDHLHNRIVCDIGAFKLCILQNPKETYERKINGKLFRTQPKENPNE